MSSNVRFWYGKEAPFPVSHLVILISLMFFKPLLQITIDNGIKNSLTWHEPWRSVVPVHDLSLCSEGVWIFDRSKALWFSGQWSIFCGIKLTKFSVYQCFPLTVLNSVWKYFSGIWLWDCYGRMSWCVWSTYNSHGHLQGHLDIAEYSVLLRILCIC